MELELGHINILIGANGSGKTNFLSFFEFLRNIYSQNLRGYVAERGVEKILHKGAKITEEISSKLSFGKNKYSFAIKAAEVGFVFTHEGLWYSGNPKNGRGTGQWHLKLNPSEFSVSINRAA